MHAAFGERLTHMTLEWVRALKWPQEREHPLLQQTGTSWVELAISWMCYHQCYIPAIRKDHSGVQRLLNVSSVEEAAEISLTYTECWYHPGENVEQSSIHGSSGHLSQGETKRPACTSRAPLDGFRVSWFALSCLPKNRPLLF